MTDANEPLFTKGETVITGKSSISVTNSTPESFVFTKDELIILLEETFAAGRSYELHSQYGGMNARKNAEQYINFLIDKK